MKNIKRYKKTIAFLVLMVAIFGMVTLIDHRHKVESVQLSDGSILSLRLDFYDWESWGSPHALQIGGKAIAVMITSIGGKSLPRWLSRRDERCFLAIDSGVDFWLATLDRTNVEKPKIRAYLTHDKGPWIAGSIKALPINKAVQNMWLDEEDQKVLSNFDPSNIWVRKSLTSRLWWVIRNGSDVEEVPEEFVANILKTEFQGRNLTLMNP